MPLEVWGGIEATVVRIGSKWRSQVFETGHYDRPGDLDRIASLGIRTLRYPILWESVAPNHATAYEWSWHDRQLQRLQSLKINVIAGLVHHGSGPCYTELLDDAFSEKLAAYAGTVAARYPWIECFTPVNEPLTTARFSALYGHWYPHRRDDSSFLRAVINQCRGIVLAMQTIRRVTPGAKLIQTEDLGRTFSSPLLQYQAEFENHRRWLSLDLLCGRVGKAHPLRSHLLRNGVSEAELGFFQDNVFPPDTLGMNHYPTSERYLDERCELFAPSSHGGNGRHRYADVEAIRVDLPIEATGPQARLQELWDRYELPVAITEVHHGCTREEQLRWLMQAWQAGLAVRKQGANVRAVTVWALFGVVDWNSLLLHHQGHYEAGAFDIRNTPPRPTILAAAVVSLAKQQNFQHPVLAIPGWWRRDSRLYEHLRPQSPTPLPWSQPLLILGNTDLAYALAACCTLRGLPAVLLPPAAVEEGDPAGAVQLVGKHKPWAVIHTDFAASDVEHAAHPSGTIVSQVKLLAAACDEAMLPFVILHRLAADNSAVVASDGEIALLAEPCNTDRSSLSMMQYILREHTRALILDAASLLEDSGEFQVRSRDCLSGFLDSALDLLVDGETGLWQLHSPDVDAARRFVASGLTFIRKLDVTTEAQHSLLSCHCCVPTPSRDGPVASGG